MIEDNDLLQFLQTEEQNARDEALDDQRAVAISMYQGEPFGNEVEGRSALVTREVAQTVDYDLIGTLKTCVGADRVVQFETQDQASADKADEASALIHYQFMRQQDGYRVLHDWIKSGLLEKTGVVKSTVEPRFKTVPVDVPEEALEPAADGSMTIQGQPVVGELEHLNPDEFVQDELGNVQPAPAMYRATVRQPLPPAFLDAVVPNEEFGASSDARDLETAPYLYHVQQKSLSDLHKMGFEFDDNELWSGNNDAQVISDARDSQRSRKDTDAVRRGALRRVWFREEYAFYDFNGDGIAERIFVQRVGRHIFHVEEIDDQPFEEWCPYPMAGRRVGQSLADKCSDIQVVNSTLLRQGMDSLYLSTNPRTLIHESSIGDSTIDDLLTVRSGMLIRYTGQVAPQPWATLPVHQQAFEGMALMTDGLEARTGITRLNQGLDIDTFDRTASGTAMIQTAGQQMQEYRARNFVEAVRRLFAKKYRMMRKYGMPVTIMVEGKPKQIDPRTWPEEIDIRVNVGLGTGNKDKRLMLLQQAIEATSNGMDEHPEIFTTQNLYNLTREWYQNASLGLPSDFVTAPPEKDPNAPPAPTPPDPEAIKAQGEAAASQAKVQSDHEQAMARLKLQEQEQQASAALKAQANDQDLQAKREKTALDMRLARERAQFEADEAVRQREFEEGMAERRFLFDQEMARSKVLVGAGADDSIPNLRPGGDLSQ